MDDMEEGGTQPELEKRDAKRGEKGRGRERLKTWCIFLAHLFIEEMLESRIPMFILFSGHS